MTLNLDSIFMLVPATWDIRGAGAIPTSANKNFVEGRLEAVRTDVSALVAAGVKIPGALFEASGTNGAGGQVGVVAGVYDTGGGDPIPLVREAVGRLTPAADASVTNIFGRPGVRTLLRCDDEGLDGGSVICDYWAGLRTAPTTTFVLLRFWRSGAASPDEEELFDDVAGSFFYGGGGSFAGPLRPMTLRKYGPPGSEGIEPGRFRYAGWRLGTVFHSKMVPSNQVALATEFGFKPRDGLLLLMVFLAWLVATLALVGMGPVLLLGGVTMFGALPQLRSRGLKAVAMLAVVLGGLLLFGVTTS